MQIVLFEEQPEKLYPVSMTRATFDIQLAGTTLYKSANAIAEKVVVIARPLIQAIIRNQKGKAKSASLKDISGDVLFLNARIVPDLSQLYKLEKSMPRGSILKKDDVVIAARCPASRIKSKDSCEVLIEVLSKIKLKPCKLKLELLNYPWELVQKNSELLASNVEILAAEYSELSKGVYVGDDVSLHPTAVLDTSHGSIIIADDAKVKPYAVLEGPLYIGPECVVNPQSSIAHSSLSRCCKVGGEIESVSMQAYSNKQHNGFLGHSFIGSWVNIGAGSCNSDLKNTYGSIKVALDKQIVDTKLQFFGCVIGDFSKMAINTTILTGKIIGVSAHVYGMVAENVPSFTNYAKDMGNLAEFYLESAIETQKRMFDRRGLKQTKADVEILNHIYKQTDSKRRLAGIPKTRFMFR